MKGFASMNLTFSEKDFDKLVKKKKELGAKNWEEFFLALCKK